MYANIIVNISHDNLDQTFQYRVPEKLADMIQVGDYVRIPFGRGNRIINGYVLELTQTPEFDPSRQKDVISIETDTSLVESKLLKLAFWMKNRYGSTMITALRTVLPIKRKVKEKEEKTIVLATDVEQAHDWLRVYQQKHRTARARLLSELIREGMLPYALVTGKLNVSAATIRLMQEDGVLAVKTERVYRNTSVNAEQMQKLTLNKAQREIADEMIHDFHNGLHPVYLIHGITGSGKTEVYMEVIEAVVLSGRQVIVLIPEIALTYQTMLRFYKRFGDRVSTLHSKLSDGEKYDQFDRAKTGQIDVMIGPRSALFTPFPNIGLIVIDEEHETSYHSNSMPKYHAREVAVKLAKLHQASVILGSATPSLSSYYEAVNGNYKLFSLKERAKEALLPQVHVVDLREEMKAGNRSIFSRELKRMIEERLQKGEQTMLFLNRRGYAGFISCRSCGHVVTCPHCDVSLSEHFGNKLVCHYCGYETVKITECPQCHSKMIGSMRAGTEQIEMQIKKAFPYARVLRMDADTTKSKDSYEKILSAFANREAEILVGTQMIVKGHDFPYVTLVGILAADLSLYANDYRASERTFQLLTQAAGRAGRGRLRGDVIIQTYNPEHYSVLAAASQDYEAFYREEIAYRALLQYPPCAHLMAVLIESPDEAACALCAAHLAELLKNDIMSVSEQEETKFTQGERRMAVRNEVPNIMSVSEQEETKFTQGERRMAVRNEVHGQILNVIGPADASVRKLKDIFRKLIYVKSPDYAILTQCKNRLEAFLRTNAQGNIRVTFDFDPTDGY